MALSRDYDRMLAALGQLGAGKHEENPNELRQAPEEEGDFDILNDETFGDLGDADYDWEDEHKRMAEELEGSAFFDSHQEENETKDSGFITMDRGRSTASVVEDELERSIRRLVVEDHESKAFTLTGQPIPGAQRQSHLEELFGPNSPPGLLELEPLGSPAAKNIWGSPLTDSPFQKPVNTLQALFASAKQAAIRDFTGVFQDSKPAHHQVPPLPLPAEAHTLAEIEHNMMAREHQKPRILTATELERQLRGEPPLPPEPRPQISMPAPIPAVGTAVAFRKPQPPGPMSMMGPRMSNGESSPINIVRPQHGPGYPIYNNGHDSPMTSGRSPSPSPSHVPQHPPPGMMAQSPCLMSPYSTAAVMMANRMFGNPMMRPSPPPTNVPPRNVVSPFGSPYGSPSAATVMSRLAHGPNVLDQQSPPGKPGTVYPSSRPYGTPHMQSQHIPYPHGRESRNNYGNQNFYDRRDHNFNQRNSSQNNGHFNRPPDSMPIDREADDPYSGLMTKKEKDWIIKIQLIQLQTDNPYLDDYYYTYYTMRKKAADRSQVEGNFDGNNPELIIPSMMKIEPRQYTPAQFEGSLGRLTAASVHNPRQIIDVCRNNSPTGEESGQKSVSKELRRYRQLLMDIEKGFNNILDIDDIEKKILALPPENRLPLFEERSEKIHTVYSYFMHMQGENYKFKNFVPTLAVRKGRKLLARLMSLTDKIQSLDIVTVLLSHLPILIKKDEEEEGLVVLMPQVSRHMSQCDLEFLVHYAAILQRQPEHNEEGLSLLMHNKFGISLLCCMIKAGEDYFEKTSPLDIDNQLKTKWTQFIEEFVEGLQGIPLEKLATPSTRPRQVSHHVDRFINNKIFGTVEDKLARLAEPPQAKPKGQSSVSVSSKSIPAS